MRFGNYEVVEQVGAGSTATVFQARELGSGRFVAIKQLSAQLSSTPAGMDRLRAEAATLESLDDPHVVALLTVGLQDDPPWIAEQWVQGATLDRVLQVHGRLSGEQAVGVLRGAVQGLAHAHSRGVVHRDVAPGNVLLDTAGTSRSGGGARGRHPRGRRRTGPERRRREAPPEPTSSHDSTPAECRAGIGAARSAIEHEVPR